MRAVLCLLLASLLLGEPIIVRAAAPAPLGYVQRDGRFFKADGARLPLVGVNRYDLAGGPQAALCQHWGGDEVWWAWARGLIDAAASARVSLIRLWAFQNYAGPSGKDFSRLDKVVAYAKSKRVRLFLVLENNWGDCTAGGVKDAAWFRDGYKRPYGQYALSFDAYLRAIVGRYKNEPTVAVWQVINEGKLYEQPEVLARFLADTAQTIRSLAPRQLISGGGALQCWQGRQGAVDFKSFAASPAIDLLAFHDYDEENKDWTECAAAALRAAAELKKPLIIGEAGIRSGFAAPAQRAALFRAKLQAAMAKGAAGYLIWSLGTEDGGLDGFDVAPAGPSAGALTDAARRWPQK